MCNTGYEGPQVLERSASPGPRAAELEQSAKEMAGVVVEASSDRVSGACDRNWPNVCQVCGQTDSHKLVRALVPDSSAIDEAGPD